MSGPAGVEVDPDLGKEVVGLPVWWHPDTPRHPQLVDLLKEIHS